MRTILFFLALIIAAPASAAVSEWVHFDLEGGVILFDIELAGEPARAMLDSGSSLIGVSAQFLETHPDAYRKGRRVTISGAFGDKKTKLADNLNVKLFGVPLELDKVAPVEMHGVEILLGQPFLQQFVFQIDYPNSRMRIIDRESVDLRKVANTDMKFSEGLVHPVVRVDMQGELKPWLILDTGSSFGITLNRFLAEENGWLERYELTPRIAAGATSQATLESFQFPEVTFGPYTVENVEVTVPAEGVDSNLGNLGGLDWTTGTRVKLTERPVGMLGYDVLKLFVLTVDFKKSLLHVGTTAE